MNEIAFLSLLEGKEGGIPPKHLKFNSLSFSVESVVLDKRHTRLSVYRGYSASHGYYGAHWEQVKAEKGRNSAEGNALSSPAQGRQRFHGSTSAAIPPFLVQRWHLSKIHAGLIHTLQLTENPHHGVFCLSGYKNKRCKMKVEKPDAAHQLSLFGLWHPPCSHQRVAHAWVLFWGELLRPAARLRGLGDGDAPGCSLPELCERPCCTGAHQENPARHPDSLRTF